jgi:hypothetical protein
MFLAGQFSPTAASFVASSGVEYNCRAPRSGTDNSDSLTNSIPQLIQQQQQRRGVLGFDVFELDAVRTVGGDMEEGKSSSVHQMQQQRRSTSTSRLQISRSNVDMDVWNKNGEFFSDGDQERDRTVTSSTEQRFFPAPGLNRINSPVSVASAGSSSYSSLGSHSTFNVVTSSTKGFSSPSSPVRLLQHSLPAWFPWIPTKSQIESLKVNELKEACMQRGLAKVRFVANVFPCCILVYPKPTKHYMSNMSLSLLWTDPMDDY